MFHYNKDKDTPENDMRALEEGQANPPPSKPAATASSNNTMQALPTAEPGSRSLSEVDSGNDFGSGQSSFGQSASAAAFDYASRNPEKAFAAGQAAYGFARENPELAKKAAGATHAAM
jgi:hypothetical protein